MRSDFLKQCILPQLGDDIVFKYPVMLPIMYDILAHLYLLQPMNMSNNKNTVLYYCCRTTMTH